MADRVILSLWFEPERIGLPLLARALGLLPESEPQPGARVVRVTPLAWSEPALLEELGSGIPLAEALAALSEFASDDYAYEIETRWDAWTPTAAGRYVRAACPLRLTLLGTEFDRAGDAERSGGDLALDFGPEALFLAAAAGAETRARWQANAAELARTARRLQMKLLPRRRRLWSEAETDLAARLTAQWQAVQ